MTTRLRSVLLLCLTSAISAIAGAQERPNVVLVFCDDLGYGDIAPYGNTLIKTPHLNRMASEGCVLTSFYSSGNICTPSRAGLMTGRYPIRAGLAADVARPTNDLKLAAAEITIAEVLKDAGYATACIGKWHLGHQPEAWPTNQGFDYFFGLPYSNDMNPLALYRMSESIEEPVDQTTLTERYTEEAIRFIDEHRNEPFFVYLPHTMPHVPLYVSERFEGRSAAGLYGDVIETIDWSMGQLFDALDRLGLDDNTLVIFTSDNGPWWEGSAGRFRDRKGASWEGGMRVPMIVRWPGRVPAGSTTDSIAMNIDLFPTIAGLGGAALPQDRPLDGKDIFPVFQGAAESPHDYLYLYTDDGIAAVRTQRWKFVVQSYYRRYIAPLGMMPYYRPGLLFDLENDPEERYSYTREHPEIVAEMVERLQTGREELKPEMH